jgi:hypothetical protein
MELPKNRKIQVPRFHDPKDCFFGTDAHAGQIDIFFIPSLIIGFHLLSM